jgi:DNA-binding transcriptional MerR regulator
MPQDSTKLYRPYEFAKTVGMTKRALRYYIEQDILKPAYTNEAGHKFYMEDSFFEAQRIMALKFLMFPLEEIRELQKSHGSIKESLKLQKSMLTEKKEQIQAIIQAIDDMEDAIDRTSEIAWEDIFNAVKFAKYQMVQENMMEYYDARADEYDEIYEGNGPASFPPDYYKADIKNIHTFTKEFGKGNIIDIACGSGYWLKDYYSKCSNFTFLDQSPGMLKLCKLRADAYGITDRAEFVQCDVLKRRWEGEASFDSAVIGFLLGHFTKIQEDIFFDILRRILKPGSEFLIIDNTWTEKRAKKQNKEDIVQRQLKDGRNFKIYKRYFDKDDLPKLLKHYNYKVKDSFFGKTFTAVIGEV